MTKKRPYAKKVYSAFPSVREVNGELMGIFDCQISGELTDNELEELRGYQRGSRIAQHFALDTSFDERFPHCEYCRKGGLVRSEKKLV